MGYRLRALMLAVFGTGVAAVSASAADEVFRAKLVAHKGPYLLVRTLQGNQREVRLGEKVVVVSRQETTVDPGQIIRNSTLLLSMNGGEITTIVVEEVPK